MKYFVVSDIHSFYDELMAGLEEKGFEKDNPEHVIISLGDLFDRGPKPVEVYNFFASLPSKRRILIRGNHEDMYKELLVRDFPDFVDFVNGTVDTFCHIAKVKPIALDATYWIREAKKDSSIDIEKKLLYYWNLVKERVNKSKITSFIHSNILKDFYELDNYIFVHGFIPLREKNGEYVYNPRWRTTSTKGEWGDSRWIPGYRKVQEGLFEKEKKKDKILVCGHIHNCIIRSDITKKRTDDSSIYYDNQFIGIDAGTVISHKVNVLVIEK